MKHQLSSNSHDDHLSSLSNSSVCEVEISCGATIMTGEASESTDSGSAHEKAIHENWAKAFE
jgi:hypothetical protein